MNISSIVVQTTPTYIEEVLEKVKSSEFCEYHMHDEKGRIIITLEGVDTNEEISKLKVIQSFSHVMSAEMVYSYSEDELNEIRNDLEMEKDNTPDWLNDENATAKDIRYNGDLKKRF